MKALFSKLLIPLSVLVTLPIAAQAYDELGHDVDPGPDVCATCTPGPILIAYPNNGSKQVKVQKSFTALLKLKTVDKPDMRVPTEKAAAIISHIR